MNPTAKANTSARRRNRLKAAKAGHREVTLEEVHTRDKGRCCICGEYVALEVAHLEHRKSLKKGGEHVRRNLGAAHPTCNLRKGARTDRELAAEAAKPWARRRRKPLRRKPMSPEKKRAWLAAKEAREMDQSVTVPQVPDDDAGTF